MPPDLPFGPLPYTKEQIAAMTDPHEKRRAHAELSSWVVGMKKHRAEQEKRARAVVAHDDFSPPSQRTTGNGYAHTSDTLRGHTGPQRGYDGRGRGIVGYHPYSRSATYVAPKPINKSVVFKTQGKAEILEVRTEAKTTSEGTLSEKEAQGPVEFTNLCRSFTRTGVCNWSGCDRLHDPNRQALCKNYLFKGHCVKGEHCSLSHKSSAHNAPNCQHFMEDRCKKEGCRFSHVRVNPGAPNCESFGTMGYCEKGPECFELHAFECPYFSNGKCFYGDYCKMDHVLRAARMRIPAHISPGGLSSSEENSNEVLTDKALRENAITSTSIDSGRNPHHFTQQSDFISLEMDGSGDSNDSGSSEGDADHTHD